jgi:hypothetical protein
LMTGLERTAATTAIYRTCRTWARPSQITAAAHPTLHKRNRLLVMGLMAQWRHIWLSLDLRPSGSQS